MDINNGNNSVNERYLDWLPKNKTIFPINKNVKTTGNLGELIPINFFDALPGETYNVETNILTRIISPTVKPTLETLNQKVFHFQVPLRILYDNFKKVMGERDDWETEPDTNYTIPLIEFVDSEGQPVNNYAKSILSYFGIPIPNATDIAEGRTLKGINKLISNAYAQIWNDHFRDQNLQHAKLIDKSDNNIRLIAENDPDADWHNSAPDKYTGKLARINKDFDYFTNTFTDTQKGETVLLSLEGTAPIITGNESFPDQLHTNTTTPLGSNNVFVDPNFNGALKYGDSQSGVLSQNWSADISGSNSLTFSINDLRESEKLQKQRELDLVAGTRYFETLHNYFNVNSVLGLLDYSQYIGGSQGTIEISQVVNTTDTSSIGTPQGNVAGYGVKVNDHSGINVMVREHSLIISLVVITQNHTYQQGVHKFFNRTMKDHFFNPNQIGLGFQGIKQSEIYGHQKDDERNNIFGYAPANERYRKETNIITGMLNVNSKDSEGNSNTLAPWHAGDNYDTPPTLTPEWKLETPIFLDNALAIGSELSDQFLFDIDFSGIKVSTVDPLGVPRI